MQVRFSPRTNLSMSAKPRIKTLLLLALFPPVVWLIIDGPIRPLLQRTDVRCLTSYIRQH